MSMQSVEEHTVNFLGRLIINNGSREKKKRGKVQAALAYVFYEFHKLKSLDHQNAIEIKIKTNRTLLSVNTAA